VCNERDLNLTAIPVAEALLPCFELEIKGIIIILSCEQRGVLRYFLL
jgi:hypothetical protein